MIVECENCGKEFEREKWHVENRTNQFCSQSCVHEWRSENIKGENHPAYDRVKKDCENCGKTLKLRPSRVEQFDKFFCDRECKGEWRSENLIGENSPIWKGGPVDFGPEWYKQKKKCLERDDNECVICGKGKESLGNNPHVHHIRPRREFENLKLADLLSNLVTLCPEHHGMAESGEITKETLFNKQLNQNRSKPVIPEVMVR